MLKKVEMGFNDTVLVFVLPFRGQKKKNVSAGKLPQLFTRI
jgi:hypothetical protein